MSFPFLALPSLVRQEIYAQHFRDQETTGRLRNGLMVIKRPPPLALTCRTTWAECKSSARLMARFRFRAADRDALTVLPAAAGKRLRDTLAAIRHVDITLEMLSCVGVDMTTLRWTKEALDEAPLRRVESVLVHGHTHCCRCGSYAMAEDAELGSKLSDRDLIKHLASSAAEFGIELSFLASLSEYCDGKENTPLLIFSFWVTQVTTRLLIKPSSVIINPSFLVTVRQWTDFCSGGSDECQELLSMDRRTTGRRLERQIMDARLEKWRKREKQLREKRERRKAQKVQACTESC